MCGETQRQDEISDEQNDFYKQLTSEYGTTFGQSQAINGALTKAFMPILQAGPNQQGYTAQQMDDMNSASAENIGTAYAGAQKATAGQLAARGGGNAFIPSGVDTQLEQNNDLAAAGQLAAAKNQTQQDSYTVGRGNYQMAAGGLSGVATGLNPTGLAGTATGAGSAASSTANDIAQEQNSVWQAPLAAVTSLGGSAIKAFAGK